MKKSKQSKKKQEFSKVLLVWETILIWVITLAYIGIIYLCIVNQYIGELGWLATIYAFPWAAYGVSQACYYKKAEKENTKGGIKYDSVMSTITETITDKAQEYVQESATNEDLYS